MDIVMIYFYSKRFRFAPSFNKKRCQYLAKKRPIPVLTCLTEGWIVTTEQA